MKGNLLSFQKFKNIIFFLLIGKHFPLVHRKYIYLEGYKAKNYDYTTGVIVDYGSDTGEVKPGKINIGKIYLEPE